MSDPTSESLPRNPERYIRQVIATEPRAIRRRDTRNPLAATGPTPRIDDTPKWQAEDS